MSSWGCPHDLNGKCQRVTGRDCDLGMKGCVLYGRFTFADESKNVRRRGQGRQASVQPAPEGERGGSDSAPD